MCLETFQFQNITLNPFTGEKYDPFPDPLPACSHELQDEFRTSPPYKRILQMGLQWYS